VYVISRFLCDETGCALRIRYRVPNLLRGRMLKQVVEKYVVNLSSDSIEPSESGNQGFRVFDTGFSFRLRAC
jgi:hypothetical protein